MNDGNSGLDLPQMPDPEGPQHVWVAHGLAPIPQLERTEDLAEGVETYVDSAPLTIDGVICAACDATVEGAEWVCPGPTGDMTAHHWMTLLSLRMSEVEVYRWASQDEGWRPERTPRVLTSICVLCGQPEAEAEEVCPKRQYWSVFGALSEEDD